MTRELSEYIVEKAEEELRLRAVEGPDVAVAAGKAADARRPSVPNPAPLDPSAPGTGAFCRLPPPLGNGRACPPTREIQYC
ncbi:hypothetical protein SBA6_510016 [Candidatus Sulfopaludibacter sp. SbA6]|nr:hypothetical protein SBA6_510016 [Candidatus Sulfopaludibacter sp. SbA6]